MNQPMIFDDLDWSADAQAAIAELARTGAPFDANDLRARMREAPHHNMIGTAFKIAARRGVIQRVGFTRALATASHGRIVSQWVGVPAHQIRAAA